MRSLKEREFLEGLGVDWRTTLKRILKKCDGRMWNGSIWLRIKPRGFLLQTW